ncbi:hypothetical protein [Chryseobacterium sp. 2R14A]|uniref:hypothetical protein n=1 Tax=Chryseobacterium sp. 2R14A TaxID=3380353 RepID=UPI003CEB0FF6
MKKIMLLMLLFLSSLILSQNTGTKNTNDIPISDVYKGLKQGEYLKDRLQKTEVTLKSAKELIIEQEKALDKCKVIISGKDEIIATKDEVFKQEKISAAERERQLKSDITILKGDYQILQIESKTKQRKKFWTGVIIGGVSVAVLGVTGLILIK